MAIALWHLAAPRFNPFGIACLIPVFYCQFCAREKYWKWFAILMCFLLDFNAGTVFLFTAYFLLAMAINILYGIFDQETASLLYIKQFNLFLGPLFLALFMFYALDMPNWWGQLPGLVWLYLWMMVLYLPTAAVLRRVQRR